MTMMMNINCQELVQTEAPDMTLENDLNEKTTATSPQETENTDEENVTTQSHVDNASNEFGKKTTEGLTPDSEDCKVLTYDKGNVFNKSKGVNHPNSVFNGDRCATGYVKVNELCVEEH
ncbi:jg25533 [Pararge aegeria aegeria]|uniref:Jg25533 protein n=1 Tax=Pararge aegeria aegeria TaxID=348720 RepID=A0A8S4RVT7_9NEOP|nr:jg25533 [Pararge aegeria aegeria]